jgi:hypothetical protein
MKCIDWACGGRILFSSMVLSVGVAMLVTLCTLAAEAQVRSDHAPSYAVRLAGKHFIELADTNRVASWHRTFTAEMWVRWRLDSGNITLMGTHAYPRLGRLGFTGWFTHLVIQDGVAKVWANSARSGTQLAPPGVDLNSSGWHHVAWICTDEKMAHVCVDGTFSGRWGSKPVEDDETTNLCLGCLPWSDPKSQCFADIRAFRLSSTVRYTGKYEPPQTFEKDADTVTLLDFAKPQAGMIADISGQRHHGKIMGGTWIDAETGNPLRVAGTRRIKIVVQPGTSERPAPAKPAAISPDTAPATRPALSDVRPAPDMRPMPQTPVVPGVTPPDRTGDTARKPIPPAVNRQTPPDSSAQQAALDEVRSTLKAEFDSAKSAEQKAALAQRLVALASESSETPPIRFALLNESIRMNCEAGRLSRALDVVDQAATQFEVDAWKLKADAVEHALASARAADQRKQNLKTTLELTDGLIAARQFDLAESLLEVVQGKLSRYDEGKLRPQIRDRTESVRQRRAMQDLAKLATERLKSDPDNPKAHLALGQYLCLLEQAWDRGLPHLAQGDDANVREAASKELAASTAADRLVDVADAWFAAAQAKQGFTKTLLLQHARDWYAKSVDQVTGLSRVRVSKRIEEIEETLKKSASGG